MRIRKPHIIAALAAIAVVFVSPPSQAQLTTFCSGVASDVTIPGDLVVRAGESCELTNTVINGNATARAGANLVLVDSTVSGNLIAQENAFASVTSSTVAGATRLNGAFGLYTEDSEHAGNVVANGALFVYSTESTYGLNLTSTNGETFLESGWVQRNVTTNGDLLTDIYDTVIEGSLTVNDTLAGSFLCRSEVDGAASYSGNGDILHIGPGPFSGCDYNVFGSDLTLSDNGQATIGGGVIRGDLTCSGNTPAPTVTDVRLRGADQCDSQSASTLSARKSIADPAERKAEVLAKATKRSAQADAAAAEAGPAFGTD